jgi:3'(2'), 5'-bisphosphate nucleotidase
MTGSAITTNQLRDFLDHCRRIARDAGNAIQAVANESLDIQEKMDGSPLTRADRAAHEIIMAGLEKLSPRLAILSEEGSQEDLDRFSTEPYWLVDPLDGTKEFIAGRSDYTVNIALVENYEPILGVIHVPAQGSCYFAARGVGAWKQIDDTEPLEISPNKNPTPRSAVASRSHLSEETKVFLEKNGITEFVQHGSSIKICAVAEGKADIYPRHGPTCLWDTGAGAAIARQAGCRVIDLQGNSLRYAPAEGVLCPGFLVVPEGMEFQL